MNTPKKDWNVRIMLKGETRSRYPIMTGYYTDEEAIEACKREYGSKIDKIFWAKAETRFDGISTCYIPPSPSLEELLAAHGIKKEDLMWGPAGSEWVKVATEAGYM